MASSVLRTIRSSVPCRISVFFANAAPPLASAEEYPRTLVGCQEESAIGYLKDGEALRITGLIDRCTCDPSHPWRHSSLRGFRLDRLQRRRSRIGDRIVRSGRSSYWIE